MRFGAGDRHPVDDVAMVGDHIFRLIAAGAPGALSDGRLLEPWPT